MKKFNRFDVALMVCRILIVICSTIHAFLYFSEDKNILGIFWAILAAVWVGIIVDEIKQHKS
jgi:hypothetical protein